VGSWLIGLTEGDRSAKVPTMPTTRDDIRRWLEDLYDLENHFTHLIVVCDTFDWEDYPIYVRETEDVNIVLKDKGTGNMRKVMEVYSRFVDREKQLAEHRSYHLDSEPESEEIANKDPLDEMGELLDVPPEPDPIADAYDRVIKDLMGYDAGAALVVRDALSHRFVNRTKYLP
jgi:hypothetical protein